MASRCAFAFLVLLGLPTTLSSQWDLDPSIDERLQRGIDHIYNLEFYDADKLFDEVIRFSPDHPAGYFFRAMTQWWRILAEYDNESQDDRFYDMLENVIEMCDEQLEKNPDDITALFFKGGSLGFRGRLRANRGNWFGAAKDGLAALPIVQQAYKLDPENYDVLLGIGIYNYYAEVIPDEYPIVKPFMVFFPSGDRQKGIQQLRLASEHARYAKTEAKYFLMQNHFQYEKNYVVSMGLAKELNKRYPRNPVFLRYVGRCHVSLGGWEEAFRIFSEVLRRHTERQVGFDRYDAREAYYYVGKYFFGVGQMEEALQNFLRCDEISRGLDKEGASGFMSMANLHIGMIHDMRHERDHAVEQYRKVLRMKEYENSHRDAGRYAESPYRGQGR
ncbi:MAG TPA: hypothetical protein VGA55_06285 [Bacteroidota bacterium]